MGAGKSSRKLRNGEIPMLMPSSDPGLENSAWLSLPPVTGWGNASWDLAQVNRESCKRRSRALHFNPS